MKIEPKGSGSFVLTTNDREYERLDRLCQVYGMEYERVLEYMFAFADYMAKTRILDNI